MYIAYTHTLKKLWFKEKAETINTILSTLVLKSFSMVRFTPQDLCRNSSTSMFFNSSVKGISIIIFIAHYNCFLEINH